MEGSSTTRLKSICHNWTTFTGNQTYLFILLKRSNTLHPNVAFNNTTIRQKSLRYQKGGDLELHYG
uniref:Uncharacterized protein n=1 Tax=Anguilla anguilla TaxID=7936 RepID=A0A0E9X6T9_ANGAN